MIHSKNHKSGFTLIEVIISMTIAALVLSPILIIYGTVLQFVSRSAKEFDCMVLCKNFMWHARQKQEAGAQEFSLDTTDVEFDAKLVYSLAQGVDQKSSLAGLKGLHKEVVTISWTEQGVKKQDRVVTFIYKKPEQKKS